MSRTLAIAIAIFALTSMLVLWPYLPTKAEKVFDEGGELKVGLPNAANAPLMTIKLYVAGVTNPISVEARDIIYDLAFQSLAATLPNGTRVPLLATQWTISPDGRVYTIKLRENVKWSDGVAFNASDVLFTWDVYRSQVQFDEFGISPYVEKAEMVNATAVRFTLKEPFSSWLEYFLTYMWILPKHEFKTVAAQTGTEGINKSFTIGTGPFQIVNFKPGDMVVHLVRNTNYWGPKPHLQNITIILLNPDANIPGLLQTKQVDLVRLPSGTMVPAILSQENMTIDIYPSQQFVGDQEVGAALVLFNCLRPPYDNKLVRKAISLAIDTQAIVDYALGGYGAVASPGGFPADLKTWVPSDLGPWKRNVTEAKRLLEKAGFVKGADGFYQFPNGTAWKPVATTRARGASTVILAIIDQNLKEAGINVQSQVLASASMTNAWYTGTYEFSVLITNRPTFPDFIINIFRVDPGQIAPVGVHSGNTPGYQGYHDWCRWASAAQTKAIGDARRASTYQDQFRYYGEAQRIVADELPYFTLYYTQSLWSRRTDTFEGYDVYASKGFMFPMAALVTSIHLPSYEAKPPPPPPDNTMLYVAGAVVIIVVLAALYFLTQRK